MPTGYRGPWCAKSILLLFRLSSQKQYSGGVLKKFTKLTGKHLCWSLFLEKFQVQPTKVLIEEALVHAFFREFCEIYESTHFVKHLQTTASIFNEFLQHVLGEEISS